MRVPKDSNGVQGPGSLYTGCLPAIVSMAIGGAVFYGTYDWLKSACLLRRGANPRVSSFLLRTSSTCMGHPRCSALSLMVHCAHTAIVHFVLSLQNPGIGN